MSHEAIFDQLLKSVICYRKGVDDRDMSSIFFIKRPFRRENGVHIYPPVFAGVWGLTDMVSLREGVSTKYYWGKIGKMIIDLYSLPFL